jgi:hypothetical protein
MDNRKAQCFAKPTRQRGFAGATGADNHDALTKLHFLSSLRLSIGIIRKFIPLACHRVLDKSRLFRDNTIGER